MKSQLKRVEVRLTLQELKCLEALIQEHYNDKGVALSKNQFLRSLIAPSLQEAQNWLVWEEGEKEERKARGL